MSAGGNRAFNNGVLAWPDARLLLLQRDQQAQQARHELRQPGRHLRRQHGVRRADDRGQRERVDLLVVHSPEVPVLACAVLSRKDHLRARGHGRQRHGMTQVGKRCVLCSLACQACGRPQLCMHVRRPSPSTGAHNLTGNLARRQRQQARPRRAWNHVEKKAVKRPCACSSRSASAGL